jgi:hypothetical protein
MRYALSMCTHHVTVSVALLVLMSACGAEDEGPQPGPLQVGVATAMIPAPLGIGTAGYAGFTVAGHPSPFADLFPATERLHGPPQFRAAVISRGPGFEAVFLRADLVGVFQQLRRAVVLELEQRMGRDLDDALIFGATHTHSGPGRLINGNSILDLIADSFFPEYYDRMVKAAADAVERAYEDLQPGELGHVVADASAAQHDRRCEDGPDHVNGAVRALLLRRQGRVEAVVLSFAVHGTVLPIEALNLSRDVPGGIEQAVESSFDGPVKALFFNGWAADVAPGEPNVPARSGAPQPDGYDQIEQVGLAVAQALAKQLPAATWQTEPELRLRTYRFGINRELIGYGEGEFPYPYGAVYCGQSAESDCDPKTKVAGLDTLCLPFNKQAQLPAQTLVTVGRVGAFLLTTFPGEPGTRLGEAISADVAKAAGGGEVMFVGYAQDYTGYSLLEEDWWQGGYEASGALWGPRQGEYLREQIAKHAARAGAAEEQPLAPLSPFAAGAYTPRVPTTAESPGTVVEKVKPSYGQTDVVTFTVAGGDPWLGAPVATLQTADGTVVTWRGGAPVDSSSYAFYVDLTPSPSYKDEPAASSRQFAWRFSMPVRHKHDIGLPDLAGSYRLSVALPTASGDTAKTVTSAVFTVAK